jgi:hypothetical protein
VLDYLAHRLAPLASLAAQRRWIVNASADSYVVREELLENAQDAARYAALPQVRGSLPSGVLRALERLVELAGRVTLEGMSNEVLVESDPAWAAAREQAKVCLDLLGFDLARWEAGEG